MQKGSSVAEFEFSHSWFSGSASWKKKLLVHVQHTVTEYMKLHYSCHKGD